MVPSQAPPQSLSTFSDGEDEFLNLAGFESLLFVYPKRLPLK